MQLSSINLRFTSQQSKSEPTIFNRKTEMNRHPLASGVVDVFKECAKAQLAIVTG